MIHSDQPALFFGEIGRSLLTGGILIICDDMAHTDTTTAMQQLFQSGWLAPNLVSPKVHQRNRAAAGFRLQTINDHTSGIHLRVLPDWLARSIGWCQPIWQWSTLLRSVVGSMALQQCLADGSIRYMIMVFEKHE